MWDTCTSHFGPKKIDRVGRRGQGRSKYITLHGPLIWPKCAMPKSRATFQHKHTPISGIYGFKNHFWLLESGFLIRKSEKKSHNLLVLEGPIFKSSPHQTQPESGLVFWFKKNWLQAPCGPRMYENLCISSADLITFRISLKIPKFDEPKNTSNNKHRKNCECCPGHYLSTSVY